MGELCRQCRQDVARRAARVARVVAGVTTVGVALYVVLRMPPDPTSRMVGAMSVIAWYILVNVVVRRVLTQHLP